MGTVQNARTAVEVLTQARGSVREARTAVEVLTKQRGSVREARTAVEVLTQQRGSVRVAREALEVMVPNVLPLMFEWGVQWVVIPSFPTGLMLNLEVGISPAFQTDGGSAATADNDPVGSWVDTITGTRKALASGSARPLLKKSVYNGRDTLRFDGSDDFMSIVGDAADQLPNITLFIVAKATAAGGRMLISKSHTMSGWSAPYNRWGFYNNGSFYSAWNGNGTNTTAWTTGDLKIIELVDADAYANGVKVTDGTDADLTYPNGNTPILIGGNGVGSERWAGDIARIMVFNRSLDATERTIVRQLLASNYGVTLP